MSQYDAILTHLQSGKTLTALEALDRFGCMRLASRITDLKKKGHTIHSETIEHPNGKRYARYKLLRFSELIP